MQAARACQTCTARPEPSARGTCKATTAPQMRMRYLVGEPRCALPAWECMFHRTCCPGRPKTHNRTPHRRWRTARTGDASHPGQRRDPRPGRDADGREGAWSLFRQCRAECSLWYARGTRNRNPQSNREEERQSHLPGGLPDRRHVPRLCNLGDRSNGPQAKIGIHSRANEPCR